MLVQRNDVASSKTVIDATMLVRRVTVTALGVEERNNAFKAKFAEYTDFCGNVDADSFVIDETGFGFVVSALLSVNEITTKNITVDISDPEFEEDNICSLVTKKFQKEHGVPINANITMTNTHHTMHGDVIKPAMIPFRMAVLVTDRDDITDYQLDRSEAFGSSDPSSGDDAGGSGNDDAESFGDDRDSDSSQPTGPCTMCGAIGPSGHKCEVGSDCNSDAGGTFA